MEKEQEENAGRAHVVLLPFPAQGHVNPMLEFGKRLAARGLPVTLAITRFVARSMPQPEMTGVVRVVGNISDGHDEGGLAEAESVQSYLDGFKAAGSRTLAELIREEDARGRPVRGVVYDSHLPWVPDVAKGMGLLAAAFFTQSCAVSAVYHHAHHGLLPVPPPGPTVSIEGLPALRLDETSSFISRPGHYPEFLESVVNQYLNLEKADAVFVNTFYHLEPQSRASSDRRRWSFRKSSAGNHVQSNSVVSEPPTVKESQDACQSTFYPPEDGVALDAVCSNLGDGPFVSEERTVRDADAEESAATVIQATIRRHLSHQEVKNLKSTIKLQAAIRGHLVRRQAAGTLRCVHAIIKMQTLVRARTVHQSVENMWSPVLLKLFYHSVVTG